MIKNIIRGFMFICLMCVSFALVFADPSAPPAPPILAQTLFYNTDEFADCSVMYGKDIRYCKNYKIKRVIQTQSGAIISDVSTNVCGEGNNEWIYKTLTEDWICPNGYGIAENHEPGVLDPKFDTLSYSAIFPLMHNTIVDLYFNAYVPACVNRIPMINVNPVLSSISNLEVGSEKTGLYAKHETLDYDASPTGGVLEEYTLAPEQQMFTESYNLNTTLRAYRFWSFRKRFVQGLNKIVDEYDLNLPTPVNIDALNPNQPHSVGDLYLSKDFMLGAQNVDNAAGNPMGEEIVISLDSICYIDVKELNINGIRDSHDLQREFNNYKSTIMNKIAYDPDLCGDIESDLTLSDVNFDRHHVTTDSVSGSKRIYLEKLDDLNIYEHNYVTNTDERIERLDEFETWARKQENYGSMTRILRDEGELSRNYPSEEVVNVRDVKYNINEEEFTLKAGDFNGVSDSDELKTYLLGLNIDELYDVLRDERLIDSEEYLVQDISNPDVSKDGNDKVKVKVKLFPKDFEVEIDLLGTTPYYGFAYIDLKLDFKTTTEHSWSWRELQDLTLTNLARCLYNWDECLMSEKTEPDVSWTMNEVADFGYGPQFNTLAWNGSIQNIINEGMDPNVFSKYFDGARGEKTISHPMKIYRNCELGEHWKSLLGTHACVNNEVYRCNTNLSNDEITANLPYPIRRASVGDTLISGSGEGYVCTKTDDGYYTWERIEC